MSSRYCPRCDFGPLKDDMTTCRRCGASLVADLLPVPEGLEPAPARVSSRPPAAPAGSTPPSAPSSPPPRMPSNPPARPLDASTHAAPTLIAAPDQRPQYVRSAISVAATTLVIGSMWLGFTWHYGFDLLLMGPRLILSPTVAIGIVVGALVGVAAAWGAGAKRDEVTGFIGFLGAVALGVGGNWLAVQLIERHTTEQALLKLNDREYLVTWIADLELNEERTRRPQVPGPNTAIDRRVRRMGDYPTQIWARAEQRYDAMTPREREVFLAEREAHLRASVEEEPIDPWSGSRLIFLLLTAIGAGVVGLRGKLGAAEV